MKQNRTTIVHRIRAMTTGWILLLWLTVTTRTTVADIVVVDDANQKFAGEEPPPSAPAPRGLRSGNGGVRRVLESERKMPEDLRTLLLDNGRRRRCRNLSDILCETAIFESFCEMLNDSGAFDDLFGEEDLPGGSTWTIFAPTNTALEGFLNGDDGDDLSLSIADPSNYNDTNATVGWWDDDDRTTEFLEFHVIRDRAVGGADFRCDDELAMSSGGTATVLCGEDDDDESTLYLVGNGNAANRNLAPPPRIVVTDVVACDGVLHVLDGVLIDGEGEGDGDGDDPTADSEPAAPECKSIQEAVCGVEELSFMCAFLEDDAVGLLRTGEDDDDDDDGGASWTVFAPTNDAFEFVEDVLDSLDPDTVRDILRFHALPGVEAAEADLGCGSTWRMGNGQNSTTTCSAVFGVKYQVGSGNADPWDQPRIVATDSTVCRGVVHTVNHVLLPDF